MVNHVKTLLLNKTQSEMQGLGFPYGEPWIIDPKFEKVEIPDSLVTVHDAMFHGVEGIDGRINRVKVLSSYSGMPDLQRFSDYFDKRKTETDTEATSLYSFFALSKDNTEGVEPVILSKARSSGKLFSAIGSNSVDSVISGLSDLYFGSFESSIRVGAVVLAYCVQLDAVSRGLP